jgi:hypothetical protein
MQMFLGPNSNRFVAPQPAVIAQSSRVSSPSPERLGFVRRPDDARAAADSSSIPAAQSTLQEDSKGQDQQLFKPVATNDRRAGLRTAPEQSSGHRSRQAPVRKTHTSQTRAVRRVGDARAPRVPASGALRSRSQGAPLQSRWRQQETRGPKSWVQRALGGAAKGDGVYPAEAALVALLKRSDHLGGAADQAEELQMCADALVWDVDCAYKALELDEGLTPASSARDSVMD